MTFNSVIGLMFLPTILVPLARAEAPDAIPRVPIEEYASYIAQKYALDERLFKKVIWCESRWEPSAIGDSGHSIGLVQIHLPSHPDITRIQALDSYFAMDFMAQEWTKGNAKKWSCWRLIRDGKYPTGEV